MERYVTLTLTSYHINNVENMVLRMNLTLLLKKLGFAFYYGGHVGF